MLLYFEYFANITDTLNIPKFPAPPVHLTGDPVLDAIQKYASHPSILKIKAMAKNNGRFEFSSVDPTLIFSEISKMDSSKKTSGAIPTDKLKLASSACYREIAYHINNAISTNMFPNILKVVVHNETTKSEFMQFLLKYSTYNGETLWSCPYN